jgi:hypothetical protein
VGYGPYKDGFWTRVSAARVLVEGDGRVGMKRKMSEKIRGKDAKARGELPATHRVYSPWQGT